MPAKLRQRCPILIEFRGGEIKVGTFASRGEQPADIAIMIREKGWNPYRVRFDDTRAAWIVSSLDMFPRLSESKRNKAARP